MVRILSVRVSILFSFFLLIFLTSCGEASPTYTGTLSVQPIFSPVIFSIDTNGNISVKGNLAIETPIGIFTLSAAASAKPQPDNNTLLLIIKHIQNNSLVESYYRIQTGQEEVKIITNGTVTIDVKAHEVTLDASNGSIQSIEVRDARWNDSSSASASTPTASIPSPTPTLNPTPTPVPPTPTPALPPKCANQNGALPNGVESTHTLYNCTLPSGFAAMTVICDGAHLLQPFDQGFSGPAVISYQSTTGNTVIAMQAENSALGNGICPSKFLVVSLAQVDRQAVIETQRLKALIGNDAGVNFFKIVDTDITRTYS